MGARILKESQLLPSLDSCVLLFLYIFGEIPQTAVACETLVAALIAVLKCLIKISAWPRSTQTCARPRRRHLYCYCFSGRLRAHTLTHPCPYWYSYLRRSTPLFTFPHFPPGRRGQGTDAFHGSSSLKQARAANMKLLNFHTLPGLKTIRKNERRNRNRNGRCILHSFPN